MDTFSLHHTFNALSPTKHLCILVPAPLWHLICTNSLYCTIGDEFALHYGVKGAIKELIKE